ncbi:MAG: TolC family protein [Bacteroidales bacterium]
MKRSIKESVFIVIFILSSFTLKAQESISLSLEKAVEYALQYNKVLQNAKFSVQSTKEKIWETTAAGLPQASASINYNNYLGANAELRLDPSGPPAIIEFNPTSSINFSVNQLVFSGNYYVGLQMAKIAYQAADLSVQKTELDIKEQVTRAYYLVLVSERTVKIIESNKINSAKIYEKTRNLANAGIIEKTEADKLSVMVTSVENAQKAAERQLEIAYNMLRLQLGADANTEINLTTLLDEVSQKSKFENAVVSPFNIENNIDYNLILVQGRIAKSQVSLQKTNYLPTLTGFYSYTEKLLKPKFDMTPKNVVGLNLSVPIFSSGMRKSKVAQAKINLKMVETNTQLVNQQLTIQEKQLRYNLNNMLEQYENQKTNVDIAKEVFDKMNLKFQQGIVSSLELTSANNSYLSAESSYINILFQLLDAELALRKLNGNF